MDLPPSIAPFAACRRILRVFGRRDHVVFEIFVRHELRGRLQCPADALGLPGDACVAAEASLEHSSLPTYIVASLASGFGASDAAVDPVWLLLDRPAGFLPQLPWEQLLQERLKAPILRLPHLSVPSYAPRTSMDVAVCFSLADESGDTPALALSVLETISARAAASVRVYVFAAPVVADTLERERGRFKFTELTIYRLPDSSPLAPEGAGVSNPWLLWMLQVLAPRAVDCVQFVTHCVQIEEQGRLEFAPFTGEGGHIPLRANAREVATFLERAGAWAAAFISPPSNRSAVGMRMLLDQVAWLRPGELYLVTIRKPPPSADFLALAAANRFVLGPDLTAVPKWPQVVALRHPATLQSSSFALVRDTVAKLPGAVRLTEWMGATTIADAFHQALASDSLQALLNEATLATRFGAVFSSRGTTPVKIAAAQRALERVLAQISDPLEQQAIRVAAKKTLEDAVERFSLKAADVDASAIVKGLDGIVNWWTTWRAR